MFADGLLKADRPLTSDGRLTTHGQKSCKSSWSADVSFLTSVFEQPILDGPRPANLIR
jgi:hypothetical protein